MNFILETRSIIKQSKIARANVSVLYPVKWAPIDIRKPFDEMIAVKWINRKFETADGNYNRSLAFGSPFMDG